MGKGGITSPEPRTANLELHMTASYQKEVRHAKVSKAGPNIGSNGVGFAAVRLKPEGGGGGTEQGRMRGGRGAYSDRGTCRAPRRSTAASRW